MSDENQSSKALKIPTAVPLWKKLVTENMSNYERVKDQTKYRNMIAVSILFLVSVFGAIWYASFVQNIAYFPFDLMKANSIEYKSQIFGEQVDADVDFALSGDTQIKTGDTVAEPETGYEIGTSSFLSFVNAISIPSGDSEDFMTLGEFDASVEKLVDEMEDPDAIQYRMSNVQRVPATNQGFDGDSDRNVMTGEYNALNLVETTGGVLAMAYVKVNEDTPKLAVVAISNGWFGNDTIDINPEIMFPKPQEGGRRAFARLALTDSSSRELIDLLGLDLSRYYNIPGKFAQIDPSGAISPIYMADFLSTLSGEPSHYQIFFRGMKELDRKLARKADFVTLEKVEKDSGSTIIQTRRGGEVTSMADLEWGIDYVLEKLNKTGGTFPEGVNIKEVSFEELVDDGMWDHREKKVNRLNLITVPGVDYDKYLVSSLVAVEETITNDDGEKETVITPKPFMGFISNETGDYQYQNLDMSKFSAAENDWINIEGYTTVFLENAASDIEAVIERDVLTDNKKKESDENQNPATER